MHLIIADGTNSTTAMCLGKVVFHTHLSSCFTYIVGNLTRCSVSELHQLQRPHTPYILFYKMIQPNEASGNAANIDPKMFEYPELADLPIHLSEYVHIDNISYAKEIRSSQPIIRTLNGNNNDTYRSDDNDEPPSSCGGNFAPSYNRFIS